MELLADEDAHVRCAACIVLGNFRAVQATNRLIVALEDRNPYVRWNAARALGYIGDVRAAIPLIRALGDTYRNVRRAACDALSAIGDLEAVPALSVWAQAGDEAALQALRTLGEAPMPCDEAVARLIVEGHEAVVIRALPYPEVRNAVGIQGNRIIPLLLQAASDGSYAVRRAACILLGQLRASEAFQALTERLRDHNRLVRQAACQALGELGDPQAVPYLSEVLDDTDSYTRQAACYALGMIARNTPLPREAITQLAARLDDSETSVRRMAFTALQYAGAVARDILIERLQNSQSVQVRQSVCRLLQAIRDEEAMQALMHALMEDESRAVRLAAARALVSRGADAVPMLIRTLARADITTLRQICTLFGGIGDAAAVPVLLEQLSHPNDAVRRAACMALGVIGDPQALPALSIWAHAGNDSARRALQQMGLSPLPLQDAIRQVILRGNERIVIRALPHPEVRAALIALGDSTIPLLVMALGERDRYVHSAAASTLSYIGASAIPTLILALEHRDPYVRWMACRTLRAIADRQATRALIKALEDENAHVRWEACRALLRIADPQALDALIEKTRDENSYVRQTACKALGAIASPRAIPALLQSLTDQVGQVRWAACYALGFVGDAGLIPRLQEVVYNDANPFVRQAAARAIEQIQQRNARALSEAHTEISPAD
jgi:HEAT repeat protein